MLDSLEEQLAKAKQDIFKMWCVLDDISTYGDMFKPDINGYFLAVSKRTSDGLATCHSDGHKVFYNGEELKPSLTQIRNNNE